MTTHLELDRETKKAKAPAKAWKNRWLVRENGFYRCDMCGDEPYRREGDTYRDCCDLYPSEQAARQDASRLSTMEGVAGCQSYIGPIEVPA